MDKEKLIEVYSDIARRRHCTADDILVRPSLREEFVLVSREAFGADTDEEALLRKLLGLRKKGSLPTAEELLA